MAFDVRAATEADYPEVAALVREMIPGVDVSARLAWLYTDKNPAGRALIKTELDPNNEVVVVLGDKAHVEKTFADAGIKDVKIIEPEYKK